VEIKDGKEKPAMLLRVVLGMGLRILFERKAGAWEWDLKWI
jgi:hypothetical protein